MQLIVDDGFNTAIKPNYWQSQLHGFKWMARKQKDLKAAGVPIKQAASKILKKNRKKYRRQII